MVKRSDTSFLKHTDTIRIKYLSLSPLALQVHVPYEVVCPCPLCVTSVSEDERRSDHGESRLFLLPSRRPSSREESDLHGLADDEGCRRRIK